MATYDNWNVKNCRRLNYIENCSRPFGKQVTNLVSLDVFTSIFAFLRKLVLIISVMAIPIWDKLPNVCDYNMQFSYLFIFWAWCRFFLWLLFSIYQYIFLPQELTTPPEWSNPAWYPIRSNSRTIVESTETWISWLEFIFLAQCGDKQQAVVAVSGDNPVFQNPINFTADEVTEKVI